MVVCAAWADGTDVTLGQIAADTPCGAPVDIVVAQTGTSGGVSYTVPAGQWTTVSWTTAGSTFGKMALVVFRPTGNADEYLVVGSTRARTLTGSNTFSARIRVEGGDLIGLWAKPGTACGVFTGSPSDTLSIFFPTGVPEAGTTMTLVSGLAVGYRLAMKVTLSPG